jgi:hypothetical protein
MSRRTLQEMTTNDGPAQRTDAGADLDQGSVEAVAYQFWLARGCPVGSPEVDWFRAEENLSGRTELVSIAA